MKKHFKQSMKSAASLISALAILMVGILPALISTSTAYAAGEVTSRSVAMTSSAPSATGVTYTIQWTPYTTATNVQYIVVQFCDHTSSPIPTDTTCNYPSGMSIASSTTFTNAPTFTNGLSACTFTSAAAEVGTGTATYNTAEFTDSSGCAQSATADTITLPSDVTNPNYSCTTASACEFYARILTYSAPVTYTTGDQTSILDEGGVAMSLSTEFTVSATVEESINFCVYADTYACGGTTNITIGSGTPPVLSDTTAYYSPEDFDLVTNASKGAIVSVLGGTLTSGSGSTIPANTTTGTALTAGTAGQFGLYLTLTSCSAMTAAANYTTSTAGVYYGATATTSSEIASSTAPDSACTVKVNYGAIAGTTTPSGVYSTSQQLIATSTY